LKAKYAIPVLFLVLLVPSHAFAETISIGVGGISHDVEYTADGVTVLGVEPDLDFISIIFSVEVTGTPGIFEITLNRNFIDSVYQGADDPYIIIADGDEPVFVESETTSTSRTLQIELPPGTEEVEIIGTDFGDGEPIVEEPVVEEPEVVEEPTIQCGEGTILQDGVCVLEPVMEEPKVVEEETTECGTGTVLKDGVCVLDESCGPGTILEDGVCVLAPVTDTTISKGEKYDTVFGVIAAIVIAGVVGIALVLIGKALKHKE